MHGVIEVPIGGGDDTDVDAHCLAAADRLKLLLLQDAQQLDLRVGGHLANLVEQDRAAVGHLESADPFVDGAGERASDMPEQLALDEARRDRAAIHLHQRPIGAPASAVHRSSK